MPEDNGGRGGRFPAHGRGTGAGGSERIAPSPGREAGAGGPGRRPRVGRLGASGKSRRTQRAKRRWRFRDWLGTTGGARLPHQSTPAPTGGRNLWLDEIGGRLAAHPLSRRGADAGLGLFRGRDVQFAADNPSGNEFAGRMKDARVQGAARIGPKTRSKQPSGAVTWQKSALRSDQ